MNENNKLDKIKPGTVLTRPPIKRKLKKGGWEYELEDGQSVFVQLRVSQIGPANPRMNCTMIYTRIGKTHFRHLVEEVT